jgi:hypothetical protein
MAITTIYATYSGRWDHFGGGPFYNWIGQSSQGGQNGGIGGCKLAHYKPVWNEDRDDFGDCGKGFVQFNTSSIPANATISATVMRVGYIKNSFAFGGVGIARSTMAVGWRYNEALDEHYHENIITGNDKPDSGIRDFGISNPNVNVVKAGWTKYHIGTSHTLSMISPGPAAPNGADDFNMDGVYDSNPPRLIITWTTPPVVTTGSVTEIEGTTARLFGTVTDYGGGTVTERGVCWSTSANPTTANSKATSLIDAISVGATGLSTNTTYHYRAYVITENSTQYGADQTFITDTLPLVTSVSVDKITSAVARGNGNVTFDGRGVISERGYVLNRTGTPTTSSTKFVDGSGTGAYSLTLTGLLPGLKYFVRAYCINGVGISYGAEISFITPSGAAFFGLM